MFGFIDSLFADQEAGVAGVSSMFSSFLFPLILIMGLFYFMLYLPNRKREKKHQDLLNTLKRGDRIVTSSGIFATVSKVTNEQELEVEIADNVKVRLLKSMVAQVIAKTEPSKPAAPNAPASNDAKTDKKVKKLPVIKKK
jgi:preprotein translocase subunit YajC